MANWLSIKKIDSHVHILPKEVLDANPDSNDEFSHAKEADLIRIMDRYRGFQWKDAVKLNAYFDISAILPDYILLIASFLPQTGRAAAAAERRRFMSDTLIF